jgi:hypothetical protein
VKRKVTTSNYKLDLPTFIKVRIKVFHILLLKPAPKTAPLEEEIEVKADKEEFEVEKVVDFQHRDGTLYYLIR